MARMGTMFIIHLVILITFGLNEASEQHTRAEPNLNLDCFNDYISEMMCILTPAQLDKCTEYSLNASRDKDLFTCDFTQLNSSACECSFNVSGIILNENYEFKVLKRKNLLFTKNVSTQENIKPKRPFIVSVTQTQDGNFDIVWDSIYRTKKFDLISELTYYVEGKLSRKNVTLINGKQEYCLVGRNLESNSNYIVRARMKLEHSLKFSDYSDPYKFTTPVSPTDNLKIIIPIICVILIIGIFSMYCFYKTIVKEWWEKIPTPKIATNFAKQVPNLMSFQNDFSPVHLESSKVVRPGENTRLESSLVDAKGENSLSCLGKDGNSSEVVNCQTYDDSVGDNNAHWELVKESESANLCQMTTSTRSYKNIKPKCDAIQRQSGNSFDINNKLYMLSSSDKLPKHTMGFFDGSNKKQKNQDPVILTDFEYSPFTGCLQSENSRIIDCAPTDQAFISNPNNDNLIMETQICSKNKREQDISCDSDIIQNSAEEQSLSCEPELKRLCGPGLHTSKGIQMDCSYHRV